MPKLPKITITPVNQVLAKQFVWKLGFNFNLARIYQLKSRARMD